MDSNFTTPVLVLVCGPGHTHRVLQLLEKCIYSHLCLNNQRMCEIKCNSYMHKYRCISFFQFFFYCVVVFSLYMNYMKVLIFFIFVPHQIMMNVFWPVTVGNLKVMNVMFEFGEQDLFILCNCVKIVRPNCFLSLNLWELIGFYRVILYMFMLIVAGVQWTIYGT